MKDSNLKKLFKKYPSMGTYNMCAAEVINFLYEPEDDIERVQNLVDKPDLICISVSPIADEIQLFHHVTQIGGTLRIKEKYLVGLCGF